ncbi:MAG TPA: phosphoribosylpyrophosphate synthetase [Ignavibacteria bacterium]|nr:phosphoribosylpyrophosphate synthetase [Ignavibacteria bacterium]
MKTLSEVLNKISEEGFTNEIEISGDDILLSGKTYNTDEIEIVKVYRFEGESNPDDMSALYLFESKDGNKGILIDAYGTYSNPCIDRMLKKIKLDNN